MLLIREAADCQRKRKYNIWKHVIDAHYILCYSIIELSFMHRKTSKTWNGFLVSFFVVKNSRIQAKGANTMERSYWIIQKKYKHIGGRTWNRKLWNTKEVCAKKNSF